MKNVVLTSIIFMISVSAFAQPGDDDAFARLNRAHKICELKLRGVIKDREELISRMCNEVDVECPNFPVWEDREAEIEIIDDHGGFASCGPGYCTLKSCYGTFLQITPEGKVTTTPTVGGPGERFLMPYFKDDYFMIGSGSNQCLVAPPDQKSLLKGLGCKLDFFVIMAKPAGTKFFLEPVDGKKMTFRFRTENGEYLVVNKEGNVFTFPYSEEK